MSGLRNLARGHFVVGIGEVVDADLVIGKGSADWFVNSKALSRVEMRKSLLCRLTHSRSSRTWKKKDQHGAGTVSCEARYLIQFQSVHAGIFAALVYHFTDLWSESFGILDLIDFGTAPPAFADRDATVPRLDYTTCDV